MPATTFIGHFLGPDTHANRPAAAGLPNGTLYVCTTDHKIERVVAGAWADYATLGGGISTPQLLAQEYGPVPGAAGTRGMYRIPYIDGAAVTFTVIRATLHLETAGSTPSTVLVEKSSATGAFTPATVATLT